MFKNLKGPIFWHEKSLYGVNSEDLVPKRNDSLLAYHEAPNT